MTRAQRVRGTRGAVAQGMRWCACSGVCGQLAGEDAPSVPVAVEYRGHSDARLKEVQATAQVTNASLTVRTRFPIRSSREVVASTMHRGSVLLVSPCCCSFCELVSDSACARWFYVQALLAKKNETIKMYQRRLDEMSREREAERASDAAQKASVCEAFLRCGRWPPICEQPCPAQVLEFNALLYSCPHTHSSLPLPQERLANEVFQENQEAINRLRLAMEQLDRPQDDGGLAAASAARTQLLEQVASMEALLVSWTTGPGCCGSLPLL